MSHHSVEIQIISNRKLEPDGQRIILISGKSPLANPFQDMVASEGNRFYDDWLHEHMHFKTKSVYSEMKRILERARIHKIVLYCQCGSQTRQCHAQFIRNYLLKLIKKGTKL